jgi:hypothetical protein
MHTKEETPIRTKSSNLGRFNNPSTRVLSTVRCLIKLRKQQLTEMQIVITIQFNIFIISENHSNYFRFLLLQWKNNLNCKNFKTNCWGKYFDLRRLKQWGSYGELNAKLRHLCVLPGIRIVKSRRLRLTEHVSEIGETIHIEFCVWGTEKKKAW